jgi:hypothetical protein
LICSICFCFELLGGGFALFLFDLHLGGDSDDSKMEVMRGVVVAMG